MPSSAGTGSASGSWSCVGGRDHRYRTDTTGKVGFSRADDVLPPWMLDEPVAEGSAKRDVVEMEKMLIVALRELTMESTRVLIQCRRGRHAANTHGRVHAGRAIAISECSHRSEEIERIEANGSVVPFPPQRNHRPPKVT